MLIKIIMYLYIFFLPIADFYIIKEGLTISLCLGMIILVYSSLFYKKFYSNFIFILKNNKSFLIFGVIGICTSLTKSSFNISTTINHILFYALCFFIYTIITFIVINVIGMDKFSCIIIRAAVLVSIIGFIEILIYYTSGYEAYANFLNHGNNVGIFMGMPRLRSTFNEPSHYALFMICILPIIFEYGKKHQINIVVLSVVLTFSSSLAIGFVFAGVIFSISKILKLNKLTLTYKKILMIYVAVILIILLQYFLGDYIEKIFEKIINVKDIDKTRFDSYINGLVMIKEKIIFGHGFANYYEEANQGIFSWYLQLVVEVGVVGFIPFLIFIGKQIKQAYNSKIKYLLFCLIIFLGQMIGMNHYYISGFWVLIAIINFEKKSLIKNTKKIDLHILNS